MVTKVTKGHSTPPTLYHWATETLRWVRSITKFIWYASCILLGSVKSLLTIFLYFSTKLKTYHLLTIFYSIYKHDTIDPADHSSLQDAQWWSIEREIRRSEVSILMETKNFFFVPRSWQDEKHLSLKKISSFAKNVETLFSVRDWGNIRNSQNFGKFFLNWGSHLSSATCWQIDNLPAGPKGRSALADKIAIVRDKILGQILSWQFLSRLLHPHWQG